MEILKTVDWTYNVVKYETPILYLPSMLRMPYESLVGGPAAALRLVYGVRSYMASPPGHSPNSKSLATTHQTPYLLP